MVVARPRSRGDPRNGQPAVIAPDSPKGQPPGAKATTRSTNATKRSCLNWSSGLRAATRRARAPKLRDSAQPDVGLTAGAVARNRSLSDRASVHAEDLHSHSLPARVPTGELPPPASTQRPSARCWRGRSPPTSRPATTVGLPPRLQRVNATGEPQLPTRLSTTARSFDCAAGLLHSEVLRSAGREPTLLHSSHDEHLVDLAERFRFARIRAPAGRVRHGVDARDPAERPAHSPWTTGGWGGGRFGKSRGAAAVST